MQTSRRSILSAGLAGGVSAAALAPLAPALAPASAARTRDRRPTSAAGPLPVDPFTLGVASGDPEPDGFVIWTRLAPSPLDGDGLGGMPSHRYLVSWQVAEDEQFHRIRRVGKLSAGPESAHAVHVEVHRLRPGREYFYRFRVQAAAEDLADLRVLVGLQAERRVRLFLVRSRGSDLHGIGGGECGVDGYKSTGASRVLGAGVPWDG